MCNVLYIINKSAPNSATTKQLAELVKAQTEEIATQKCGYSVYRNDRTFNYVGQLAYENIEKNIAYKGESIYCAHSRTSTGGEQGVGGLHLQKLFGRYIYAHNGTVSKFATVKSKSDSHFFFSRVIQKWDGISYKAISEAVKKYDFSGKGFLYDEKERKTIFFCNMPAHIYILQDAFVISSYEIEKNLTTAVKKDMLGYVWYEEGETRPLQGIIHEEKLDDIYMEFTKDGFNFSTMLPSRFGNGYSPENEIEEYETDYVAYAEEYYSVYGLVPTEKQLDGYILDQLQLTEAELATIKEKSGRKKTKHEPEALKTIIKKLNNGQTKIFANGVVVSDHTMN